MRTKVINILLECGMDMKSVECRDYLTYDILDSLLMAEIVISLEDEFNIEIDGDDIIRENFINVDVITAMVEKLVGNSGTTEKVG